MKSVGKLDLLSKRVLHIKKNLLIWHVVYEPNT